MDVRFIYCHRPTWYGTVFPGKDTIEVMDKENNLDFVGWDLRKALGLLYKGNPPLMEWLSSPMVYMEVPEAINELKRLSGDYYDKKSAIYHYLHMAGGNWNSYIKGREVVTLKKYLYIIRPLLACHYIEHKGAMPPMEIDKTLALWAQYKNPTVDRIRALIADKKAGVELGSGAMIPELNYWIEQNDAYYYNYVKTLENKEKTTAALDKYLFKWMKESWQ